MKYIQLLSNMKFYLSVLLNTDFNFLPEDVDELLIIREKLKDLAEKYNPEDLYKRDEE